MPHETTLSFVCVCGKDKCNIPFGFCHCGCGSECPPQKRNDVRRGHIKGLPARFISCHAKAQKRVDTAPMGAFKIEGIYCRLIALTQGLFTIVTATDYPWLSKWEWFAMYRPNISSFYAARSMSIGHHRTKAIYMAREILGLTSSDERVADHIRTTETLNNTRANLRIATETENKQNCKARKNSKTGIKGVCPHKATGKLAVSISADGKKYHLGLVDDEAAGIRMYAEASRLLHQEFSNTGEK